MCQPTLAQTEQSDPFATPTSAPARADASVLFKAALDVLRVYYVQSVDREELTSTALKAMFASLDGHSTYMTPKEYADFNEAMSGKISGIGVMLETVSGTTRIITPVDGSPAARAGVGSGWELSAVNGETTRGKSLAQVVQMLRGSVGESVDVEFVDLAGHAVQHHFVREFIQINSVYQRRIGDIGYLRITSFTKTTDVEFGKALVRLGEGGPVRAILLDLRNNPGGIVETAVGVTSRFLRPGEAVVRSGQTAAQSVPTLATARTDTAPAVPLAILINGGTASAAEIMSAALHDNHRALLVGLTSFGKGLVQTVFPVNNGSEGAVSMTTLRYYTPSGQSIQQVGVLPDVVVARSLEEARDAVDDRQFSEARLPHALANEGGMSRQPLAAVEAPPGGSVSTPPLFVHPLPGPSELATDFQLIRAIDLLHARISGRSADLHCGQIVRKDQTSTPRTMSASGR